MTRLVVIIGPRGNIGSCSLADRNGKRRKDVAVPSLVEAVRIVRYRETVFPLTKGTIRVFRGFGNEAAIGDTYKHVVSWIIGLAGDSAERVLILSNLPVGESL